MLRVFSYPLKMGKQNVLHLYEHLLIAVSQVSTVCICKQKRDPYNRLLNAKILFQIFKLNAELGTQQC